MDMDMRKRRRSGPTKQQRLASAAKQLEKTLVKTGYRRLQAVHGKPNHYTFPDLSVEKTSYPSMGDGFARMPGKKSLPVGAKHFPVGNSHKQGNMLITGADRLEDMGGRKT
tara:strand:+ start:177 stop:509 length:333 start_codon:yes stop_codon:yes gene_type:complete